MEPLTGKILRPFGLSDGEIIDLSGPFGKGYGEIVKEQNTIEAILKRLYFETQGGPTRRVLSKPGDIAVPLKTLDGCTDRTLMFVNFYKNMKAFCDHLPEENKLKNEPLFRTLFEKLEKARPLFFQYGSVKFLLALVFHDCFSDRVRVKSTLDQIQALKERESVILPAGSLSHAILCEVKKECDGTCSFTIFNSGMGIETYHRAVGRKYCNAQILNIDPRRLNEPFFHELFSCSDVEAVYTHLRSLGALEFDESAHYDQGKIGSCSYQCLIRWLKEQVGKELYSQIRNFTVQALLDDCTHYFDGQVRADASVRKIEVMGEEIQEADIAKLIQYAKRCLQKIGRNVQIHKAIEASIALPDKALLIQSLLSLLDKEEIQKTILDDQDRCLMLLKISNYLASRGAPFHETAKLIRDHAIEETGKIKEPEKKAAAYYEIANSLFILRNNAEALKLIEQASNAAKLISDPKKRSEVFLEIADTLFMQGNNTNAMILIGQATDAAKEISDLEKGTEAFLKIVEIIQKIAVNLFAQGNKSEAIERIDQAAEMVMRNIPNDALKVDKLTQLATTLVKQEEFEKVKKLLLLIPTSDKKNDTIGTIVDIMCDKANKLLTQGNKREYERLMDQVIEIGFKFIDDNERTKIHMLRRIVSAYVHHGQIDKAKELIERMDPKYQPAGFDSFILTLNEDANLLFSQGNTSEANRLVDLAIGIATSSLPDTYAYKSLSLQQFANTLHRRGEFVKAQRVIAMIPDPETKAAALCLIARTLFSKGNGDDTKRFLSQFIEAAEQLANPDTKSEIFHEIAQQLVSQGDKERAKSILNQAIELAKEITEIGSRTSWLYEFSEALLSQGDIEGARKAAELIPDEEKKRSMLQKISTFHFLR